MLRTDDSEEQARELLNRAVIWPAEDACEKLLDIDMKKVLASLDDG